jgi:hypothetical protein
VVSEASVERDLPTGDFFVGDGYDLSIFEGAPGVGPYRSFTEAEAASRLRADLAAGGSPD